jgi:plasmid stability protein
MAALTLKNIPEDLLKHILKVQADTKIHKAKAQYSMESAIYKILREHKELRENKLP